MKFFRVNEWLQASFEVSVGKNEVSCYNCKSYEKYTHSFESFYKGTLYYVLTGDFTSEMVEHKCLSIIQVIGALSSREERITWRREVAKTVVERNFDDDITEDDIEAVMYALKLIRG